MTSALGRRDDVREMQPEGVVVRNAIEMSINAPDGATWGIRGGGSFLRRIVRQDDALARDDKRDNEINWRLRSEEGQVRNCIAQWFLSGSVDDDRGALRARE